MKIPFFASILLLVTLALTAPFCQAQSDSLNSMPLELAFGKREGTFVLKKSVRLTHPGSFAGSAVTVSHNGKRAKVPYSPCSTFKIPSSLIALNTGLVKDIEATVFNWSADKCNEEEAAQMGRKDEWCKDQSLKEAFVHSTVWAFKDLAHTYGEKVMKAYLTRFQYGNMNMQNNLTSFWLMEGLKISANDQIKFLEMFHTRRLGLSQQTYDLAEKLFTISETENYRICAKTGLGKLPSGRYLGWYVGYVVVNKPDTYGNIVTYYFAMNMEESTFQATVKARKEIVQLVLASQGIKLN